MMSSRKAVRGIFQWMGFFCPLTFCLKIQTKSPAEIELDQTLAALNVRPLVLNSLFEIDDSNPLTDEPITQEMDSPKSSLSNTKT